MNKCIILTHGDLGQALLGTAGKIIGEQNGIKVISNENTSLKDLITGLEQAMQEWQNEKILIMVDFCGGSCWHAAQVIKHNRENVALLSGVNLPIVLSYINRRDSFKLAELAEYLKESSARGTSVISGLQLSTPEKETEE